MLKLIIQSIKGEATLEDENRTISITFFDQVLYRDLNKKIDFFRYSVYLKQFVHISTIELLENDELIIQNI
jgi:hypothetical protein